MVDPDVDTVANEEVTDFSDSCFSILLIFDYV